VQLIEQVELIDALADASRARTQIGAEARALDVVQRVRAKERESRRSLLDSHQQPKRNTITFVVGRLILTIITIIGVVVVVVVVVEVDNDRVVGRVAQFRRCGGDQRTAGRSGLMNRREDCRRRRGRLRTAHRLDNKVDVADATQRQIERRHQRRRKHLSTGLWIEKVQRHRERVERIADARQMIARQVEQRFGHRSTKA
jgi:hypothetical protein